ncbi:MAG: nucleotidyltransferase domain-containing protein [Phycisphaerales bacterium]
MILADHDLGSYNTGMVSDEVLNEVKQRLVDGFHPEKIILFGSQARGTADDRSDVDILVVCEVPDGRRSLTLAMDRALWGLRLARDLVVLTPEEYERDRHIPGTIARYASLGGRVFYEDTR